LCRGSSASILVLAHGIASEFYLIGIVEEAVADGIGKDADMEVGRILAQATDAEFQGVTDKDLARLLEEFSKYF